MLFGRVTGVHHSSLENEHSVIRLAFDSIRVRGNSYPFDASITNVNVDQEVTDPTKASVARTRASARSPVRRSARSSAAPSCSKIITGGLLGAAAGTVVSLGTGTTQSVIPSGTHMTVRSVEVVRMR